MKRYVFFFAALTCAANLYAVEPVDTAKAVMLQDVQVTSTRAGKHTPMAFSNFDQSQIKSVNFGQDIPYILSLTPSIYNPQNEMFRHRKTKCFICKTKRI